MRGPSAIKSRRPEESVKAMAEPIKTGRAGASKPHFPTKSANSIRTGRFTSPRMSAGKALMERAARRMKLHSQKQLVKQTSCAVKAAGTVTKKAAAVTVKVARSLMSAVIGLIGGAGFFVLLAVILLGGALSAFGSSPGSGSYTPVSAEVEAFDPIIRIYATQHGIPEYVDLIKAVMMQESGGSVELVGGDVMQCAEGMGLPVGTPVDPEKSIDFGTSIIADNLRLAGATGPGDIPHISLALQGYNFGNGYISWPGAVTPKKTPGSSPSSRRRPMGGVGTVTWTMWNMFSAITPWPQTRWTEPAPLQRGVSLFPFPAIPGTHTPATTG